MLYILWIVDLRRGSAPCPVCLSHVRLLGLRHVEACCTPNVCPAFCLHILMYHPNVSSHPNPNVLPSAVIGQAGSCYMSCCTPCYPCAQCVLCLLPSFTGQAGRGRVAGPRLQPMALWTDAVPHENELLPYPGLEQNTHRASRARARRRTLRATSRRI